MKNKIFTSQILILTITIFAIAFFNIYALIINETNHTSYNLNLLLYFFTFTKVSYLTLLLIQKQKKWLFSIFLIAVSICGTLNVKYFQYNNIMLNYGNWLDKGIPDKPDGFLNSYKQNTSRFLPNPEGERRDFENLNFVEHFLTQTNKIEISFIETFEQFSSREKITPQFTITDQAEIKKILSFISEKSEYITAIGKLPNEEILKSGRMYFYINKEHVLTANFYKDNIYIKVAGNKIGKMNISPEDIVSEPRSINPEGVKYIEKIGATKNSSTIKVEKGGSLFSTEYKCLELLLKYSNNTITLHHQFVDKPTNKCIPRTLTELIPVYEKLLVKLKYEYKGEKINIEWVNAPAVSTTSDMKKGFLLQVAIRAKESKKWQDKVNLLGNKYLELSLLPSKVNGADKKALKIYRKKRHLKITKALKSIDKQFYQKEIFKEFDVN